MLGYREHPGRGRPLTPVFPALPTAGASYKVISIIIKLITLITKKQCIVKLKCWLAFILTLSSTVMVTVHIFFSVRWKSKTWYRYMYLMNLIKSATSEFENRNLKFYEREIGRQMLTYFFLEGLWRPPGRHLNCLGFLKKKNLSSQNSDFNLSFYFYIWFYTFFGKKPKQL